MGTKPRRRFSRRKFLTLAGLSALGVAADVCWIEPCWLGIGRHSIKLPNRTVARETRVLQLSDLHASSVVSLAFIENAVQRGLELKPDIVLLTGDFITGHFDDFEGYAKVLRPLAEACPCYATLGNHDGGIWAVQHSEGYSDTKNVRELLNRSGVRLLHNEATQLNVADTTLNIVGLGDLWAHEFLPADGFVTSSDGNEPTLLLSHNPDTKEYLREYGWDVMFCGHTHGGQFRVPLVGTPFAPVRDKRFVKGLHSWENRWIHITKGVGNLHGMRFNCRPEISLVTLS
jgi:predicted MPP superfamily phosphohydrolase